MLKLEFAGRLTDTPKVFDKGKGAVVAFTVAVNYAAGKEVEALFLDCKCFGGLAAQVRKLGKGDLVYAVCTGRLEKWEKDGKNYSKIVWLPVFLQADPKTASGSAPAAEPASAPEVPEDDVPF